MRLGRRSSRRSATRREDTREEDRLIRLMEKEERWRKGEESKGREAWGFQKTSHTRASRSFWRASERTNTHTHPHTHS